MSAITLKGPKGIRLHLDRSKFYPDDPGQDTPALVEYKNSFSTYSFVTDMGETVDGVVIPAVCLEWLDSDDIQEQVEKVFS